MISKWENNQERVNFLRDSLKCFNLIKKNIYLDRKRKLPKHDEIEPCLCIPRPLNDNGVEYNNVSYNCG